MENQDNTTRRKFLKTVGRGAATVAATSASAPGILHAKSPNETIGVRCIGIGVRGGTLVKHIAAIEGVKVVAVCDVYKPHVQKGIERCNNPDVRTYLDYRELIANPAVDPTAAHCRLWSTN